ALEAKLLGRALTCSGRPAKPDRPTRCLFLPAADRGRLRRRTPPPESESRRVARHYLDHASTSPAQPEVVEAMLPWLAGLAADPGRVHTEGRMARAAVETAREQVAALVGARPREVVFTSGATEAINAAVWGASERGTHLVAPAVEHSAVLDA